TPFADPPPRPDQIDPPQQCLATAEDQPRFVEPSALDALHRKGDRPAGADGIEAQLVASLRRAEDVIGAADANQGSEREEALILDANTSLAVRINMLAPDRARHAAFADLRTGRRQLVGETLYVVKAAALKVARR